MKSHPIDSEEIALLHKVYENDIPGHTGRGYTILGKLFCWLKLVFYLTCSNKRENRAKKRSIPKNFSISKFKRVPVHSLQR